MLAKMDRVPVCGRNSNRSPIFLLPCVKRRIGPIVGRRDAPILDRVPMNIIDMPVEVFGVADRLLPQRRDPSIPKLARVVRDATQRETLLC